MPVNDTRRRTKRVAIIGLDCAAPRFLFGNDAFDLPNLRRLAEQGYGGPLRSCDPPITVPAWTCMTTGAEPGELGLYGFRNRKDHSYAPLRTATASAVMQPRVWDTLSRAGKKVIVLGVPQTWPPKPVNGCLVSGFMTPSTECDYTWPPELKNELPGHLIDVEGYRDRTPDAILADIYALMENRFEEAHYLLRKMGTGASVATAGSEDVPVPTFRSTEARAKTRLSPFTSGGKAREGESPDEPIGRSESRHGSSGDSPSPQFGTDVRRSDCRRHIAGLTAKRGTRLCENGDCTKRSEARAETGLSPFSSPDWDFFMMVEMGLDRLHHVFWHHCVEDHPLFVPDNPYRHVFRDYYTALDKKIGELCDDLPDDTAVMVVSDHGTKSMLGGLRINQWLMNEGLLVVHDEKGDCNKRSEVRAATGLSLDSIDWSRTKVWSTGGYYARLFFNVEGREPNGIIPEQDYESFRKNLAEKLRAMPGPDGQSLCNTVYTPEELYPAVNGVAPDLLVYLADLDYRALGGVGYDSIYSDVNDTGLDTANHDRDGILIMNHPWTRDLPPTLLDITPTVLALLQPPD